MLEPPAVSGLQFLLNAFQRLHVAVDDRVVVARQQVPGGGQAVGDHVVDVLFVRGGQRLVEVGDPGALPHPALTAFGDDVTVDHLEERGLSYAVAAQQADALAAAEREIDRIEQHVRAVVQGGVFELQQGHAQL